MIREEIEGERGVSTPSLRADRDGWLKERSHQYNHQGLLSQKRGRKDKGSLKTKEASLLKMTQTTRWQDSYCIGLDLYSERKSRNTVRGLTPEERWICEQKRKASAQAQDGRERKELNGGSGFV